MAARNFREKEQQQSRVFFDVIFDVYTHVEKERKTEKELERVIQNKGDEFRWEKNMKISWRRCREKIKNASGQQGEIKRQGKK